MKKSSFHRRKKQKELNTFIKTTHFQERQHERNVCDQMIRACLQIKPLPKEKITLIVSRRVLRKLGFDSKVELILILKNRVLITTFCNDLTEFILYSKRKHNCLFISEDDLIGFKEI